MNNVPSSTGIRITLATSLSFALLLFCLSAHPVLGEETKAQLQTPRPVGLVNSSNGGVYQQGQYCFIFKYIDQTLDQMYDGSDEIDFVIPRTGSGVYEKSARTFQATLRAGLFKNIDARVIIPYLDKELKVRSTQSDMAKSNSDIGDIKLISRYRIMSQKSGPLNLAAGIGVSIPTGKTDETDSNGKTLAGYLQPGSGSWNPILELGAHKIIGPHWLSGYFMYQLSTEGELGENDYTRPDIFKYNFGYAYAINNYLDLGLELNGEVKSKAENNGVKQTNTGGHSIYLSPEIHFKIKPGLHLDFCLPIAVYHDVNGVQLTEDYRFVTKLAWKF